jgi:uncharacterized membrane protein
MSPRIRSIICAVAILAAFIGVTEATYLFVMYLTGDIAVCGGAAGCSEVLTSRYSKIGPVPVAALGACAYFIAFACATFSAFGHALARKLFGLVVAGMLLSTLWFLYVQMFILHAFCRYCLFSAALVFFLAGTVVMIPLSDSLPNDE